MVQNLSVELVGYYHNGDNIRKGIITIESWMPQHSKKSSGYWMWTRKKSRQFGVRFNTCLSKMKPIYHSKSPMQTYCTFITVAANSYRTLYFDYCITEQEIFSSFLLSWLNWRNRHIRVNFDKEFRTTRISRSTSNSKSTFYFVLFWPWPIRHSELFKSFYHFRRQFLCGMFWGTTLCVFWPSG